MGYFVQISNAVGVPVFQASKNYQDVSFAAGALFHALVTASLEQGFVPSILRANDAAVAVAIHGPQGGRVVIAMVTSELAAGETSDLEARLHWRLQAVYHGALLALGGEQLRRQHGDSLRRLLAQRLTPIVAHIMAEEDAPGLGGRVPRLGLTLCGAAVEWLGRCAAADALLEHLLTVLPLGSSSGGGSSSSAAFVPVASGPPSLSGGGTGLEAAAHAESIAMISWQGRALAATPAWRRVVPPVDRALLLSLAEQVGPATFERPGRSWANEEIEQLWIPTSAAASVHLHGSDAPLAQAPVHPAVWGCMAVSSGAQRSRPYRMISARLYPGTEPSGSGDARNGSGSASDAAVSPLCEDCRLAARGRGKVPPSEGRKATLSSCLNRGEAGAVSKDDAPSLPWWDGAASTAEAAGIWAEEASVVVSVLEEIREKGKENGGSSNACILDRQSDRAAAQLQESAASCEVSLRDLWRNLKRPGGGGGAVARQLLRHATGDIVVALLHNELSHDVITVPSPWHSCASLPWQCVGRRRRVAAVRRLLYWIHMLPPLGQDRTQQYACCEGYEVAAIRRDDGLHCWAVMNEDTLNDCSRGTQGADTKLPNDDVGAGVGAGYSAAGYPSSSSSGSANQGQRQGRVLAAVAKVLLQVPRSADLRSIFSAT
eukprot:TRINITY_DN42240_c0_g1_i1.p1 TRINITY_DN42240_c0_g1~~TRINITY_DN42240_c0_g1_i1.p1  ORF type:complete len:658 (+),score=101.20 TRINITY_DN42240_c0_g1_i1:112-2085(+)